MRREVRKQLRARRRMGAPISQLVEVFELEEEKVRATVDDIVPQNRCLKCDKPLGEGEETYCHACRHCSVCGAPLAKRRYGPGMTCVKHTKAHPHTYRSVKRGVYRSYNPVLDTWGKSFYTALKGKWYRFDSLREAQQQRQEWIDTGVLGPRAKPKKKGKRKT